MTRGRERRGLRAARRMLAVLAVFACAGWALRPLGPATVGVAKPASAQAQPPAPRLVALDVAAFKAPLWVAPVPPPPAVVAPPLPPLRLRLLAIVKEESGLKALLYDPDSDSLLSVGAGDTAGTGRAGGRIVTEVTAVSVRIQDAGTVRTLSLNDTKPTGGP
jgi:hypothetical protein